MRAILLLCLLLAPSPLLAQDKPDPRLVGIAQQKQRLEEQAERGRLLIENAQLKFRSLVEEEKRIVAKQQPEEKEEKQHGK